MQYSMRQGVHSSWNDPLLDLPDHITSHNWLPAAVGSIAVVWLALLFVSMNQSFPAGIGIPSKQGKTNSHNLNVSSANTSANQGVSKSTSGSSVSGTAVQSASGLPRNNASVGTSTNNVAGNNSGTADNTSLGGKGADDPTSGNLPGVPPPPATIPVDPPASGTVITIDPSVVPPVILEVPVNTPVPTNTISL